MSLLTKDGFAKARDFILTDARMIERRLFDYYFSEGSNQAVYHAVYAYRNNDGGFGHGMEPDTASPESQPLFTLMAMEILDEVGYLSRELILRDFMPYFQKVTTEKGGVPWMLRPTSTYPCQEHFLSVNEWAAVSTTAPLLGLLEKYSIDIPWMSMAEAYVWSDLDRVMDCHAYCYLCVPRWLTFLRYTRDRDKVKTALDKLKEFIMTKGHICQDRTDKGWSLYGKPCCLSYADSPHSPLHHLFSKEDIDADLEALISRQAEDGSWRTWYGISEGTRLEWAGMHTIWALKTLKNYGRMQL